MNYIKFVKTLADCLTRASLSCYPYNITSNNNCI